VIAAAHEYGMSQWEINLAHSPALDAADRAFRFKAAVKDLATREGLLATFMGKPFNGDAGSGFHLHLSLCEDGGANAFADEAGVEGCAELLRQFTAGVVAHAPALMAFLNPTVNAYRRIDPHELVPTRACWGYDNRFGLVRVPPERGAATRIEMRLADGSANPYLATAALLFAGLDGIERELTPPPAAAGLVYELPEEQQGDPIPLSLDAALDALEADATLSQAMGPMLVETFLAIKRYELDRYHHHVSDWDLAEYAHHL
jgi:glutamine synthetase